VNRMRLVARLSAILALWPGAAPAAEVTPGTYHYRVEHQLYGDIGEHHVRVQREGDELIVEQWATIAVKLWIFTAHRRESHYREVWRDDRLIAFDGLTVDNGEAAELTARAAGDTLLIDGSAGRIGAPAETAPSLPSHQGAVVRGVFMDFRTGALLEAKVTPAGTERIEIAGRPVEARKYVVGGELEQTLWYDATGVWAQWQLARGGGTVTLTRE
jgi:Family of unknown function (DUF6134)